MIYKTIFPVFTKIKTCEFNVWAPKVKSVHLVFEEENNKYPLLKQDFGYWSVTVENILPGTRYKYQLNEDKTFPDPASLSQPAGVHEASELIDLSDFEWTDNNW